MPEHLKQTEDANLVEALGALEQFLYYESVPRDVKEELLSLFKKHNHEVDYSAEDDEE